MNVIMIVEYNHITHNFSHDSQFYNSIHSVQNSFSERNYILLLYM